MVANLLSLVHLVKVVFSRRQYVMIALSDCRLELLPFSIHACEHCEVTAVFLFRHGPPRFSLRMSRSSLAQMRPLWCTLVIFHNKIFLHFGNV